MNLNWQHLVYFKRVAEFQNFSKAADSLYVTSSAISKAVNNLEEELGFPLFEKCGRNSVLTEYGKEFYQHISDAFRCIDDGVEIINRRRGVVDGRISLGGIYTMCAEFLPRYIKQFREIYPNVYFSMEYHITDQILENVLNRDIDLGFCGNFRTSAPQYAQIDRALLYTEELVVAVPNTHPLAKLEHIDFSTLHNELFIIHRNHNSGTTPIFENLCTTCGFTPHISFEVPDDQSILGLVKAGLGIALIADSPAMKIPGLVMIPIENEAPIRNQYMVWNRSRVLSPVAIAFRDYILSTCKPAPDHQ